MDTSKTWPSGQLTLSLARVVSEQFERDDEKQESSRDKVQQAAALTSHNNLAAASPANRTKVANLLECCQWRIKTREQINCKMVRLLSLLTVILLVAYGDGNNKQSIGQRAMALKVTVAIPDLVGLYEGFWLNCSHNSPIFNKSPSQNNASAAQQVQNNIQTRPFESDQQQQERIYSIRWYKDNDEFYRFMPGGEPRSLHLEAKGVQADVSRQQRV